MRSSGWWVAVLITAAMMLRWPAPGGVRGYIWSVLTGIGAGRMEHLGLQGRRLRWRPVRSVKDDVSTEHVLSLLEALSPALRAGLPVEVAIGALDRTGAVPTPLRPVVSRLVGHLDRAESMATAWRDLAGQTRSVDLVVLAHAWTLSEQTGAPLAEVADSVTRLLRESVAVRRQTEAALAQARATMTVLTALPLAGPLLALAVGVDPARMLTGSPLNWICILAGIGLLWLGRAWVGHQVAAALRVRTLS